MRKAGDYAKNKLIKKLEARTGIEPVYEVLQTTA